MPKVSVIVPVYNVEKYLRECVDSILAQTFADFELILVNDGSPDSSGAICDEYALKDSRVKVIHKENGGVSSARNAGLDIACGEYIYFCDSDDTIDNNLLEVCVKTIEEQGVDIVKFGYYAPQNNYHPPYIAKDTLFNIYSQEDKLYFILEIFLKDKIGCEVWDGFFKKDIINRYKMRFQPYHKVGSEDKLFSLEYFLHCTSVYSLGFTPYCYRIVENSLTHTTKYFHHNILNQYNEFSLYVYGIIKDKHTTDDFFLTNFYRLHATILFPQIWKLLEILFQFPNHDKQLLKIKKTVNSIQNKKHFTRHYKLFYKSFLTSNTDNESPFKYKINKIFYKYLCDLNFSKFKFKLLALKWHCRISNTKKKIINKLKV